MSWGLGNKSPLTTKIQSLRGGPTIGVHAPVTPMWSQPHVRPLHVSTQVAFVFGLVVAAGLCAPEGVFLEAMPASDVIDQVPPFGPDVAAADVRARIRRAGPHDGGPAVLGRLAEDGRQHDRRLADGPQDRWNADLALSSPVAARCEHDGAAARRTWVGAFEK